MYFRDYLDLAWNSISVNKLRTFLSILGITIGTAAVLSGITLGIGNRELIMEKMGAFGVNNLWVYRKVEEKGIPISIDTLSYHPLSITEEDIAFIKRECPNISEVAPFLISPLLLKHRGRYYTIKALGLMSPSSSQKIYKAKILKGRFISNLDQKLKEKICVLERSPFFDEIFQGDDPLGKQLEIGYERFRVVGIVDTLIFSFGYPERLIVLFPASTLQNYLGTKDYSAMNVLISKIPEVPNTASQLKQVLAKRFGPGKFTITEFINYVTTALDILNILTLSIVGIATISLTVGGIGIMNIMYAAVAERTREIGITKALGGQRSEILKLFLIEAVILSLIGGTLGVFMSIILTKIILGFLGIPVIIPTWAIILSFGLSVIIGVIAGAYPSQRAARLDPAEALRYG